MLAFFIILGFIGIFYNDVDDDDTDGDDEYIVNEGT